MKNIIQSEDNLVVKGTKSGSILTTFGLLSFISLPFIYSIFGAVFTQFTFGLGVLLIILSIIKKIKSKGITYLRVDKDILTFYPYGGEMQRYDVPLSRIKYLTTKEVRRGANTSVFTIVLTEEQEPEVHWINKELVQSITSDEVKLDYLPVSKKDFPEFIKLLEGKYSLSYNRK